MAERQGRVGLASGGEPSGAVVEDAVKRTGNMLDDAKAAVRGMADSQKGKVCSRLGGVAQALHQTARELEKQNVTAGRYANLAAQQVDRVVGALKDRRVEDLLGDAEDFARRQPLWFVGGALAAGFMLARLAKSTDEPDLSQPAGDVTEEVRGAADDAVQGAGASPPAGAAGIGAGPVAAGEAP